MLNYVLSKKETQEKIYSIRIMYEQLTIIIE